MKLSADILSDLLYLIRDLSEVRQCGNCEECPVCGSGFGGFKKRAEELAEKIKESGGLNTKLTPSLR